jgi:hypothetical protein
MRRSRTWILGAVILLGLAAGGCAPEPKNVPCSNDSVCQDLDDRFNYCLQSRCVECVGVSGCPTGAVCDNGACVECANDRGCPSGNRCVEGSCETI